MTKVTVAPITSTVKGLSSEVPVGPLDGFDRPSAISVDNTVTIPITALGERSDTSPSGRKPNSRGPSSSLSTSTPSS